jgi:hypothetical protein
MRWTLHNVTEIGALYEYMQRLPLDKCAYDVEIKKKTKRRTIPQNRLYWLYLTAIATETGNDRDDLHSYFAGKYLSARSVNLGGSQTQVRGTTTDLDTKAFTEYIDRIMRDAGDMGIVLISPANPLFEQFYATYDKKVS